MLGGIVDWSFDMAHDIVALSVDAGELSVLSAKIGEAVSHLESKGRSLIVVLEGLDASGKSGLAKRIVKRVDPSLIKVVHTAVPTSEELAHNYLWRFWRDLPAIGRGAIFDRSWYGRVLVERVDGLCTEEDWRRAYGEICTFERFLYDNGAVIEKFWLDIPPDVQLQRFMNRMEDPSKKYKLTDADWHSRTKRAEYDEAADDMLSFTDMRYAPWNVVPASDKRKARTDVMRIIANRLGNIR